jgi:hypothetical protein
MNVRILHIFQSIAGMVLIILSSIGLALCADEDLTPLDILKAGRFLLVKSQRPLRIDVVVNASVDSVDDWKRILTDFPDKSTKLTYLLACSSIVSHLIPSNGSIRVSILDTLKMKTFADRENAIDFDWESAIKTVAGQNPDTVDARSLGSQNKASAYFTDQLQKIIKCDANDSCASAKESPLRIVIVVSHEMKFTENKPVQKLVLPQDSASIRFFYFLMMERAGVNDDIYRTLKSTNPKRYDISDYSSFLKALKALISEIEK